MGRRRRVKLPKETKPEKIVRQILTKHEIKHVKNYKICYDFKRKLNKYFDFYIPELRLLIECDGDYYHANPKMFTELNEMQKNNKDNDKFKNGLAAAYNLKLIRFWENEILEVNFETQFLKKIHEKN